MPKLAKDPTQPIRLKASRYPDVEVGTACTQNSFKTAGKSFLFIGTQGGRFKAMFNLNESMPQAKQLAKNRPEDFQVGSTGWVTARFTAAKPLPKKLWESWLDESYALSRSSKKKVTKKKTKTTAKKTKKKTSKPKPKKSPKKR